MRDTVLFSLCEERIACPERSRREAISGMRSPRFLWSLAKTFLLVALTISMWSCELAPDKVEIAGETQFRKVNLALGDTLDIAIAGDDLNVVDEAMQYIIQFAELDSSKIRLIGSMLGTTRLVVSYKLPAIDGSAEGASAITYLDITVTEGFLLELILGEWTTITLSDYLTAEQLLQSDSISVSFLERLNDEAIPVQINASSVTLQGIYPGTVRMEIVTYDSLGLQLVPLQFETQTIIRTIILGEIFTNGGCVNCPAANHNLDLLYTAFPENFRAIRYHVFWTDPKEPMNLYNPDEVEERRIFYGNSYEAPRLLIDGVVISDYENLNSLTSLVRQNIDEGSDVHIWKPDYVESSDSIFISYSIRNYGVTLSQLISWTILTEDSIYYAGTNGETIHMQVMKDMQVEEIPALIETIQVEHALKRPPDYQGNHNYQIVTLLQDVNTQEIIQTTSYSIPELLSLPQMATIISDG